MEFQGFPKIPRYSRECVITEKIDGTNAQILIEPLNGPVQDFEALCGVPLLYGSTEEFPTLAVFAGSRSRWLSLDKDNFGFARWVYENTSELMKLGPGRHFGEWWGQGIQRNYGLKEKRFSLFNVKKWSDSLVRPACCHVVPIIATGMFGSDIVEGALALLQTYGSYAALNFMEPEGVVVYHTAGNLLFKKTFEKDEKGKEEK